MSCSVATADRVVVKERDGVEAGDSLGTAAIAERAPFQTMGGDTLLDVSVPDGFWRCASPENVVDDTADAVSVSVPALLEF